MGEGLSIQDQGNALLLTSSGSCAEFLPENHTEIFSRKLTYSRKKSYCICMGYVIMSNHIH